MIRNTLYPLALIAFLILVGCESTPKVIEIVGNPPIEGFNAAASDEVAIAIADEVMEAMGGRQAWESSRYIGWTFFGRRSHLWDKEGGMNRMVVPSDSLSVIVDLKTKTGTVTRGGVKMTNPDSVATYVEQAYRSWINDSYWLVMPFKLKDSGVTLKMVGQDTTTKGVQADVLELTFADVGVTPDNKYHVYVDKTSRLVTQWDYFPSYADTSARFQSPWPNYKKFGDILLSGGQIAGNQLTDISVSKTLDEDVF